MPGRDRTGPLGEGPRTGWGRGLCNGKNRAARDETGYGGGRGRGLGRGRGRCFPRGMGYGAGGAGQTEGEVAALREEIRALREALGSRDAEPQD